MMSSASCCRNPRISSKGCQREAGSGITSLPTSSPDDRRRTRRAGTLPMKKAGRRSSSAPPPGSIMNQENPWPSRRSPSTAAPPRREVRGCFPHRPYRPHCERSRGCSNDLASADSRRTPRKSEESPSRNQQVEPPVPDDEVDHPISPRNFSVYWTTKPFVTAPRPRTLLRGEDSSFYKEKFPQPRCRRPHTAAGSIENFAARPRPRPDSPRGFNPRRGSSVRQRRATPRDRGAAVD